MTTADRFYGATFACECGKTHVVTPREVLYETDAAARMPEVCARATEGRRVVVLADVRTHDAAGRAVEQALRNAGWATHVHIVADPAEGASPVCDDVTHDRLARELPDADLFAPVGGGVVSDLGKWLAADRGAPYVCFATCASMNGYASANVAPAIGGVKTLVRARPPVAVAADPAVLAAAPWKLTASGLGDILAKSVSSVDWRFNHLVFGDYYCERSVGLIEELEPLYLDRPEALKGRDPAALEALFQGLLLTGVAMTLAETSAPASGGEHMLSHTLDMMSSLDGVPHDLHGRQVGLGTVLASELYRRVLATDSPTFVAPSPAIDAPFWGRLSREVRAHYEEKIPRLNALPDALRRGDTWDRVRADLSSRLRSPERIRDCLRRASAAWRAEDIGCGRKRLLTAFLHAHEIRERSTLLDLAWLMGILPGAAEEIIEEWAL